MAPLRVIIVDDEPLARDCVRLALRSDAAVEVVAECGDGIAAVQAIETLSADLVYLDVQMPGLDGFGVVERIGPTAMPALIFVTAYEEHALQAFSVHAVDYLLKPFSDVRFAESLRHAREQLAGGLSLLSRRLSALLAAQRGDGPPRYPTYLTVAEGEGRRLIRLEDIDWFAGEGNYVRIHSGAEEHLLRGSLGALLKQIDPARFVRIHRSVVVNLSRVRRVDPWAGGDHVAVLHDGQKLRVSRHFKDGLLRPLL